MTKERERSSNGMLIMLILLVVAIMLAGALPVAAGANQRPIEDFVDSQGDFCLPDGIGGCFLFVPPVANFIGWSDPQAHILASFDYAGLANECAGGAFGTEMSGSITERPLADGRAEVHVRLHTTNALAFVVDDPDDTFDFTGDLLFGQRLETCGMPPEGMEAALGSSLLHVTFINTAPGAPLPDLIELLVDPEAGPVLSMSFRGRADGLLTGGTPGRVEVTETGLFNTAGMGETADGYPAEKIILRAVGQ